MIRRSTWSMELTAADDKWGTSGAVQVPFLDTNLRLRDPNDDAGSSARVVVPYGYAGDLDSKAAIIVDGVRTAPDGSRTVKTLFRGAITGRRLERGFSGRAAPTHQLVLLSDGEVQPVPAVIDNFLPPPQSMDPRTSREVFRAEPEPGGSARRPAPGPGLTTMGGGGAGEDANDARPGEDAVADGRRQRIKEMAVTKDGASQVALGEPSENLTERIC